MKRLVGLAISLAILLPLAAMATMPTTARAEGPPKPVTAAITEYYNYYMSEEDLIAHIQHHAPAYANFQYLIDEYHRAGKPVPSRVLFGETGKGITTRYEHLGARVHDGRCSQNYRPALTMDQMELGIHSLCNASTGEWTLFQRDAVPVTNAGLTLLGMDDKHCYYEHPRGTRHTLMRGIGGCAAR